MLDLLGIGKTGTVAAVDWEQKFSADFSYDAQSENPRNTDTIIDPTTGTVLAPLPPGTRNFILGPLVDSYFHNHGYDNQTRIGYIQKDTRELIILARIDGTWGDDNFGNRIYADGFEGAANTRVWNGLESGFTAINSNFTFEHLQWFYENGKNWSSTEKCFLLPCGRSWMCYWWWTTGTTTRIYTR